ncbi:Nst1, partial [Ophiophagus hannah]
MPETGKIPSWQASKMQSCDRRCVCMGAAILTPKVGHEVTCCKSRTIHTGMEEERERERGKGKERKGREGRKREGNEEKRRKKTEGEERQSSECQRQLQLLIPNFFPFFASSPGELFYKCNFLFEWLSLRLTNRQKERKEREEKKERKEGKEGRKGRKERKKGKEGKEGREGKKERKERKERKGK